MNRREQSTSNRNTHPTGFPLGHLPVSAPSNTHGCVHDCSLPSWVSLNNGTLGRKDSLATYKPDGYWRLVEPQAARHTPSRTCTPQQLNGAPRATTSLPSVISLHPTMPVPLNDNGVGCAGLAAGIDASCPQVRCIGRIGTTLNRRESGVESDQPTPIDTNPCAINSQGRLRQGGGAYECNVVHPESAKGGHYPYPQNVATMQLLQKGGVHTLPFLHMVAATRTVGAFGEGALSGLSKCTPSAPS
jgi:hypothetical protein